MPLSRGSKLAREASPRAERGQQALRNPDAQLRPHACSPRHPLALLVAHSRQTNFRRRTAWWNLSSRRRTSCSRPCSGRLHRGFALAPTPTRDPTHHLKGKRATPPRRPAARWRSDRRWHSPTRRLRQCPARTGGQVGSRRRALPRRRRGNRGAPSPARSSLSSITSALSAPTMVRALSSPPSPLPAPLRRHVPAYGSLQTYLLTLSLHPFARPLPPRSLPSPLSPLLALPDPITFFLATFLVIPTAKPQQQLYIPSSKADPLHLSVGLHVEVRSRLGNPS